MVLVVAAAQQHPSNSSQPINNNGANAALKATGKSARMRSSSTSNNNKNHVAHRAIPMDGGGPNADDGREARRPRRLLAMRRMVVEKPRQEICALLKWTCFLINFVLFLASVGCLALGLYLFFNDPRPVSELADFLLNPSVPIACIGLLSGIVTLLGMFGALRDNVVLLKLFSLCVFLAYALLVICTCLLFLMFYSDTTADSTGISAQSLLLHSIQRYQTNKNIADFMDYLQEQLECCGSTSFRDWHLSEQFQCNASNPYPERCGVPFSCCRRSVVSGTGGGSSSGGASQKPLAPAIRSIQCWQNAQKKREQELDQDIHVGGCLQPLRALFDAHALHIGMAVLSVIVPVCFGVCLSQCLARQIDYQHFLLRREQRRIERRERREQRRYREQAETKMNARKKHSASSHTELMECGKVVKANPPTHPKRPSPPQIGLPPTPRDDADEAAILRAVLKASKQEYEKEQKQRRSSSNNNSSGKQQQRPRTRSAHQQPNDQRATSFSPMRNQTADGREKRSGGAIENKHSKRKSMTLDIEAAREGGGGVREIRGRRPADGAGKKEMKQKKDGKQQQQSTTAPMNGMGAKSVAPSAPPISLILQQHHFN